MRSEEEPSRNALLSEIEDLHQELKALRGEEADLKRSLALTTEKYHQLQTACDRQVEEAAKASENQLAEFLEAMPVGTIVLNSSGKVYYVNQRAKELLGQGVIAGVTPDRLAECYQLYVAGTDRLYPSEELTVVRALHGEQANLKDLEVRRDGKVIPLETWGTPILDRWGKVVYAIAAFQDISQRKQVEAESQKFTYLLYQLQEALSHFCPPQFLQCLGKDNIAEVRLGDQVQRKMSVLFADIRDFTKLSEQMTPEDNFRFINAVFSRMEPAIVKNQGFVDKYIGDAIMALFDGDADCAVQAAISMLQWLAEYNTTRRRPKRLPLKMGIGINTGTLTLGIVGGRSRRSSTVVGDTVNLAARLERLTKRYRVSLLISHFTFEQLRDANCYTFRIIDRVLVRGRTSPVSVYEIFDADESPLREGKLVTKTDFEQAILLYYLGSLVEAEELLLKCLQINPDDYVAKIYLEQCRTIV